MTDEPGDQRPEDYATRLALAIQISRAFLKRLGEIWVEEIDRDLASLRGKETLDQMIVNAKWKKMVELTLEVGRVYERRYGTPRGELKLIEELYGDQLNLNPHIGAGDVKQRLDWYKRRIANDFVGMINSEIETREITSPIEQIFLMEWHFLRMDDRFGVKLIPQQSVTVGDESYRVDFAVTNEVGSTKLAIELDGHDFHEKTRLQAAKDKHRERAITRQGYTIVRFTGSEVVKNSRHCIKEVEDILTALTTT